MDGDGNKLIEERIDIIMDADGNKLDSSAVEAPFYIAVNNEIEVFRIAHGVGCKYYISGKPAPRSNRKLQR